MLRTITETRYYIEIYGGRQTFWSPITDLQSWTDDDAKKMQKDHVMTGVPVMGSLRMIRQTTTVRKEVMLP